MAVKNKKYIPGIDVVQCTLGIDVKHLLPPVNSAEQLHLSEDFTSCGSTLSATICAIKKSPLSMVRTAPQTNADQELHIEFLSNLSLSLDRLAGFFLVLSAVTLLVALWPTVMGYWPIMAVAVIHLAIVGWCFRLAWQGYWARQDVFVGREHTRIRTCRKHHQQECSLSTQWLRVIVDRTGREPRLYLAAHDQLHEIGNFLPVDERLEAETVLRNALSRHSAWKSV